MNRSNLNKNWKKRILGQNGNGQVNDDLFDFIDIDHIIIDELHMTIRIGGKFISFFILHCMTDCKGKGKQLKQQQQQMAERIEHEMNRIGISVEIKLQTVHGNEE